MISKNVNKYCSEDIRLIENYEKAINDDTQIWNCHHRKETDEKLSLKQIKEQGLYYNRPASELIFLTKSEHQKLHRIGKPTTLGRKHSSEEKQRMHEAIKNRAPISEEIRRKRISEAMKGKKTGPLSEEHKIEYINLLLAKNMRIYTLTNINNGEIKNFIKKTNLSKYIKTNTNVVELCIIKNTPICKKTGEKYMVECRDINIGMEFEDL